MKIQIYQAKTKLKTIAMVIGLILASVILSREHSLAQEADVSTSRKAQVTFAHPIGSNGLNSKKYSNNFSFNILYGVNGGVNAFELGGIGNYNKGKVNGVQIAGISNINEGSSRGLLLSGISNIVKDSISGVTISGIMNYSARASRGFQLSTVNINESKFTGVQLGLINYSKTSKGLQFGLINVADSVESGASIGLINIVKKGGYFAVELTGGDAISGNLNFKMGVERFYTIFKGGYSSFNGKSVYSYGLGFGTLIPFSEKDKLSIDLSTNIVGYDGELDRWDDERNILNKMDISYRRQLTPRLSLLAGPSLNHYITEVKVDDQFGTLDVGNTLYTSENGKRKISMWIGFHAGLAFRL